ncbi:Quinonprotein alcohol dehydrogenase-like superfamily [Pseudocohnilembus persalinus]|uniref:Quinonprotein alcohol dehydrogenase-like superfamily n=1 Tax=Pseudocohnilembus persalinus TaxID=266149 RepID=A0A0V0QY96_PSEPJ|nr:Quinonprotein alcohol dehydrogenase-like superfamily [Pseudocohnilembus persalinus]|eukprot:KRX07053.1 Quinonprotein alcohol dehydrogenase-like superfamily [Pseudocohnilembus persalinus]
MGHLYCINGDEDADQDTDADNQIYLLNAKMDEDNKYIVNSLSDSSYIIQNAMSQSNIGEIQGNGSNNIKIALKNDKILGQDTETNPAIWNMDSLDYDFKEDLEKIILEDGSQEIKINNATAGIDGIIYIWNARNGEKIDKLDGHEGNEVLEVKFSNDSSKLVSIDTKQNLIIWYLDESGQADYYYVYEGIEYIRYYL